MPKNLSVDQVTEAIASFTTEEQIALKKVIAVILFEKEKKNEAELKLLKEGK